MVPKKCICHFFGCGLLMVGARAQVKITAKLQIVILKVFFHISGKYLLLLHPLKSISDKQHKIS